jgi:glycosyltransferase involved in cell wall biosynthesis/ribosomal protein S18 acetylase RimI-like enzyme
MKILWVKTEFLHPTTKGGHIRTLEILKRLHTRHEIHYVAFDAADAPEGPRRSAEYCSRAYPLQHSVPRKDSPVFLGQLAAGLLSPVPVAVGRYRSAAMQRQIEVLLAEHRFDRLVCDFLTPAPNISRLRDWVLFQHNVESAIWERRAEHACDPVQGFYLRLQARRMRDYERRVCREVEKVIAVSPQDAEWMHTRFGVSRISVVPTGVDVDHFAPPTAAARVADLIFVGSMDWLPNIEGVAHFVREVLPLIRRRRPGCTLAVVGRTPTRAVTRLAAEDPGILVTGTVGDIRPYLWGSTVSIVPLRIGGGTRLKIYEAMAAGVPVVSTTIGAEGLEVSSPENIRLADTPDAFASACAELLDRPEARARQARAARDLVRARGSWESVTRAFEEALERHGERHRVPAVGTGVRGVDATKELEQADIEAVCHLLSRLSVSFAGVSSRSMSRAICEEAIRRQDPVVLLARQNGSVAGLALAVRDHARFRRTFFSRHPVLALRAAGRRLMADRRRVKQGVASRTSELAARPVNGPSWTDGDAGIAKVLFIGVAPEHRRVGLAERLYADLFERLRAHGASRIDARIGRDNLASLRLHKATGWTLYVDDGGVFATRRLS